MGVRNFVGGILVVCCIVLALQAENVITNDCFRNEAVGPDRLERVIEYYMRKIDASPNQVDSIWGEGNMAPWPSKILPQTSNVFPKWWEKGIDPIKVLLEEARKRDREFFFLPHQWVG